MLRRRASRADVLLVAVAAAWLLCAVGASLRGAGAVTGGPPAWPGYVAFAPALLVGIVLGRLVGSGRLVLLALLVPILLALLALALLLGLLDYANAQAAAGVQLIAAAALIGAGRGRADGLGRWWPLLRILAVLLAVLGLVLAVRATAGALLALPVLALSAAALAGRSRVPRSAMLGVGLGSVGLAVLGVIVLGSAAEWPERWTRTESLSSARHELWADALALWRERPLVGGGPGSFYASSPIAGSDPLLYAAHSSVLQVGAELGIVGVVLFLAVLALGAVVAVQGDRRRALIGVAAWCALAVHSMIDHLYEFPVIVVLAGAVIGWAGASVRPARRAPIG